jgi:uncharacterized protein GlcG (DUF336 family)
VLSEKTLSLDLAEAIVLGALARCRTDGNHVTITVVDRDGLVKFALRDDDASPHTITTSQRKAFTSVTFRQPSGQWAHRVLTDPAVAGLKDTAGTIALGGGLPIRAGNEVIGRDRRRLFSGNSSADAVPRVQSLLRADLWRQPDATRARHRDPRGGRQARRVGGGDPRRCGIAGSR